MKGRSKQRKLAARFGRRRPGLTEAILAAISTAAVAVADRLADISETVIRFLNSPITYRTRDDFTLTPPLPNPDKEH